MTVVTGGGSGIGRATARAFADTGARVVICGRRGDALAETASSHPDQIVAVTADITSPGGIEALLGAIGDEPVNCLVNNAGAFRFTPSDHYDDDLAHEIINVNLLAPAAVVAALGSKLRTPGGVIVNVSSRGGHNPSPGSALYGAAKAGLDSLTATWAAELAPSGIRVCGVAPGFVHTEAYQAAGMPREEVPSFMEAMAHTVPLGAVAEPEMVAAWIVWLISFDSRLVTGVTVTIDGGLDLVRK
ncbi:SDR family NAD(P)-dependent oxidoreductase [Enemella evansiae]|uniref:SDR family NAD(P)-dependent oxidoreductase n=1 Tax=Enemella evansiae TaxID=2016499 RepID=UPI001595218B|nr:SDR family oxidoreductase [Enemella evansiae]